MRRWQRGLMVGAAIGLGGVVLALTPFDAFVETRVGLNTLFHLRGVARRRSCSTWIFGVPRSRRRIGPSPFPSPRRTGWSCSSTLTARRQPIEDKDGRERGAVWVKELEPPLPILAQAAKALAPFSLPKLDAAVDPFWLFKASARDAPTMPAAALQVQVYALGAYGPWRDLLQRAGAAGVTQLPRQAKKIGDAEGLRGMMLNMRRLFDEMLLAYPQDGPSRFLLARCRSALENGSAGDEPGIINMTAK